MKAKPYTKWIIAAVILGGMWFAWNVAYPSGAWRYKMIVAVETPEGVKIGAGVREIGFHNEIGIFPAQGGTYYNLRNGEAVVIDLGKRGVLFALMKSKGDVDYGYNIALKAFPNREKTPIGTKVVLSEKAYPLFVTFSDSADPNSVRAVEDFEYTFGSGVKIRDLTIEVTGEPVTWGIEKWLPWLPGRKGQRGLIGSTAERPIYQGNYGLNGIEFSKGKFW